MSQVIGQLSIEHWNRNQGEAHSLLCHITYFTENVPCTDVAELSDNYSSIQFLIKTEKDTRFEKKLRGSGKVEPENAKHN